ncbi:uncharacterized protein N7482_007744 [Penicillium canariense]|uniref:Life-span regulatory factor n=1 Tax=Penicillium canariense TaxID=189055 RepID=A0A9W9I039_9EURO|nr:uncharacterized protein N7482_007744 [Penicillium canariense]KAJ5160740.1 hypothetical protein N7482_007744 [Penicillium canariense]
MTQSTASHRRSPSSPHTSKPKLTRPGLHRRGTSGLSSVNLSISKLGSGQSTRSHSRGVTHYDDPDMAASFLNFCAMCERQITVPNNSLLYCSESCRRKDSCKPLSASLPSMSTMSSQPIPFHARSNSTYNISTTPPNSPPLSPRTIVAPMTPTRIPSSTPSTMPSIRIPASVPNVKTDLDPTEWKPVLGARTTSSSALATSDAWSYLSQFHGGASTLMTRRSHRSTASLPTLDGIVTPSLTHAPSIASSVSSTASDEMSLALAHGSRPLPPRHNPFFSLSHGGAAKGVALVMPHVATVREDADAVDIESDSGSIFPASSAVWEDEVCAKASAPIMVHGPAQKA